MSATILDYVKNKMENVNLAFGPVNKSTFCWICLEAGVKIRHRHSSTVEANKFSKRYGIKQLFCHACNFKHAKRNYDRTRVLATTSSLHDAQKGDYEAARHFNHLSICGARLKDLKKQFAYEYENWDRPIDLVVFAGLNDVKHTDPKDFKDDLVDWIKLMDRLDARHSEKSSIMFCRLPRLPAQTWLAGDGPTPAGFTDYGNNLKKLNKAIDWTNMKFKRCKFPVSFYLDGRRKLKDGREQHMWTYFRETVKEQKMHFNDKHRHSMLKRIEKYWQRNYIEKDWQLNGVRGKSSD